MQFAKLVGPRGRVIAFEPSPLPFYFLSQAIRRNQVGEFVEIHQMALSDEGGTLPLHVSTEQNRLLCTFGEPSFRHNDVEVPVTTLDEFANTRALPHLDLIKVDVEGWETAVFRGATQLLTHRPAPVLIFEANPRHARRAGTSLDVLVDLLEAFDYLLRAIEKDGSVSPRQYVFQGDDDPQINLCGIPRLQESEILEQIASRDEVF